MVGIALIAQIASEAVLTCRIVTVAIARTLITARAVAVARSLIAARAIAIAIAIAVARSITIPVPCGGVGHIPAGAVAVAVARV